MQNDEYLPVALKALGPRLEEYTVLRSNFLGPSCIQKGNEHDSRTPKLKFGKGTRSPAPLKGAGNTDGVEYDYCRAYMFPRIPNKHNAAYILKLSITMPNTTAVAKGNAVLTHDDDTITMWPSTLKFQITADVTCLP